MTVAYSDAIRPMPVCTSLDFRQWMYELYRYRLAENPVARPGGSIYVSNSGDDSTGTGAIGAPYATIDKANEVIDALGSDANRTIYLARGSVWTEKLTLVVAKNNISIAAYGTGRKPYINWFNLSDYTAWSATSGRTDVFELPSVSTGVCAVRYERDVTGEKMFAAAFSLDQCEDNPNSFFLGFWIKQTVYSRSCV